MKLSLVRLLTFVFLLGAIASAQAGSSKTAQANNNDLIAAKWKAGDIQYNLEKTGVSMVTISGRACPGTWAVKGNTLTISPRKLKYKQGDLCAQTRVLEVVNVTGTAMDLTDAATKTEIHLVKQ